MRCNNPMQTADAVLRTACPPSIPPRSITSLPRGPSLRSIPAACPAAAARLRPFISRIRRTARASAPAKRSPAVRFSRSSSPNIPPAGTGRYDYDRLYGTGSSYEDRRSPLRLRRAAALSRHPPRGPRRNERFQQLRGNAEASLRGIHRALRPARELRQQHARRRKLGLPEVAVAELRRYAYVDL